jgi:hypothetical protein
MSGVLSVAFYPTAGIPVIGIVIAFAMMKPVKKAWRFID